MSNSETDSFKEAKRDFYTFAKLNRNDMIDSFMFHFLVDDKFIPIIIKFCKESSIDRYDLIDDFKNEIFDSLITDTDLLERDFELSEKLDMDIDLITLEYLASKVNSKNKSSILFNTYKKYPAVLNSIYDEVVMGVDTVIVEMIQSLHYEKGGFFNEFNAK